MDALTFLSPLGSELRAAAVPASDYVLFGSAVLMLHGIRHVGGDVDVFVTAEAWLTLVNERRWRVHLPRRDDPPFAEAHVLGVPVHAFYAWDGRHEFGRDIVADAFASRELVQGWPCQSLALLRDWKRNLYAANVHPKHGRDVELIDAYLGVAA
jgi:hypothetical protein